MASPQKENGHVDIANEIMEALARFRMSGNEWQVLLVILRKTYGWHKKSDQISLSQISEMTGISRSHVVHAVAKLCNRGVAQKGNTYVRTYEFQKDYSKWKVLPKKATGGCTFKQRGVAETGNETVARLGTYKRKPKETITKEITTVDKSTLLKDYLQVFRESYKQAFGCDYTVTWGRDLKCLKNVGVELMSAEEFSELCRRYFDPNHVFKGNCDVPSFVKAINRLKVNASVDNDPLRVEL